MSGHILLEVKNIKKYFPVASRLPFAQKKFLKAVDDVSFFVRRSETLGIVGESGCGKSTLGQVILQLQRATGGEVIFEGENLCALPERALRKKRKDLQIIFQDPYSSINPRKNIETVVTEPALIHGLIARKQKKERAIELLQKVGLGEHHLRRMPHEFSGGQRQRIGIARALSLNPKLIICDEPVSALDVSIQAQVLNLLSELQAEFGITYLFIAHGLPAVRHVSDRIMVMYLGKAVEFADKDELFNNPLHPYTEALLSAVPIPDPARRKKRIVLAGDIPSPINPPAGCPFHTRCVYAKDVCAEQCPAFSDNGGNHWSACHFPLNKTAAANRGGKDGEQ
jgi:oligopeptide/dipeptide ABC transporter ATP-binding protein